MIRKMQILSLALLLSLGCCTNAGTEIKKESVSVKDFKLGSLKPRGTRRVIYNSDLSNTTVHLSEPAAKPEELALASWPSTSAFLDSPTAT